MVRTIGPYTILSKSAYCIVLYRPILRPVLPAPNGPVSVPYLATLHGNVIDVVPAINSRARTAKVRIVVPRLKTVRVFRRCYIAVVNIEIRAVTQTDTILYIESGPLQVSIIIAVGNIDIAEIGTMTAGRRISNPIRPVPA